MPSATEECREPSGNCQGILVCLERGHPEFSGSFLRDEIADKTDIRQTGGGIFFLMAMSR